MLVQQLVRLITQHLPEIADPAVRIVDDFDLDGIPIQKNRKHSGKRLNVNLPRRPRQVVLYERAGQVFSAIQGIEHKLNDG